MLRKILIALACLALIPAASAATCSADLEGTDAMKFNLATITVPKSCGKFTINLKHTGKFAKNVMGHNVVVAKTSDMAGIEADGSKAGLAANYLKAGDTRVVAGSKIVGGGESTSISFAVSKLADGSPYSFFCSFPGHAFMMKGSITVVP